MDPVEIFQCLAGGCDRIFVSREEILRHMVSEHEEVAETISAEAIWNGEFEGKKFNLL